VTCPPGLALRARTPEGAARPALLAAAGPWSAATLGFMIQALAGRPFLPLA
jgi:hypothetical protein